MAQRGAAAMVSHAVDAQAGRITLEVSEQPGGPPVSGGGTLAIVEFVAVEKGDATVSVSRSVVRDLENQGVPSSTVAPLAVTIGD
jgi:hypothetical protein